MSHYNTKENRYLRRKKQKNIDDNKYLCNYEKISNIAKSIVSKSNYNEFKSEKIHYKKFNYVRIIPKGRKIYIWFQSCYSTKGNYNIQYFDSTMNKTSLQFNIFCNYEKLSSGKYGTLLYGTIFKYNETQYLNIENILSYKGNIITNKQWNIKYKLIYDMLDKNIQQVGITKNDIILVTPLTYILPYSLDKLIENVKYSVYAIQFLKNDTTKVINKLNYIKNNEKIKNKVEKFIVKACIQHDEYEIYDVNTNKLQGKAHIPNCKTSIFMNSIFRNIRENKNLDLLEESDDEEVFQNIDIDKFTNINMSKKMNFEFDNLVKQWKPIITK